MPFETATKKKGTSLFCGLICLYFKLPNPLDHLEELFLVSLIIDSIGVMQALDNVAPSLLGLILVTDILQLPPPSPPIEDSGKALLLYKGEIFKESTARVRVTHV